MRRLPKAKVMTVPQAGSVYFGLSRNGSYAAAARGELPFITIGKRKLVVIEAMERRFQKIVDAA